MHPGPGPWSGAGYTPPYGPSVRRFAYRGAYRRMPPLKEKRRQVRLELKQDKPDLCRILAPDPRSPEYYLTNFLGKKSTPLGG